MKGKVLKSIVLLVSILLVFASGANAQDGWGVIPIEPGDTSSLPDYIGAPAKPHPLPNAGVPQDPNLAPNPFAHSHSDIWMSDTVDIDGPLGRNPVTLSTTMAEVHQNSWLTPCGSMGFDSHGRPVINCYGVDEAGVVLLDPDTLEVLSYYPLEVVKGGPFGEGDQKILPALFSIYGYVDNRDLVHIVTGTRKIITLEVVETQDGPEIKPVGDGYDLTTLVETTHDSIAGVIMDFQGRYWINMRNSANIYVLNPATAEAPYLDLPRVYLGDDELIRDEFTRNGMALTKEGAAYIVTTKAMYRVDAGADDKPYVVWEEPYDTIGKVRSGQYELGSGSTPTVLGEGKYVAISDNAEQMQVVVLRTEEKLDPGEERIVCEVPVFDFPGGGAGAQSNSLIGLRNSIVVQNSSGYLFDWGDWWGDEWRDAKLVTPGAPGVERIDINPNGNGCTKVWVNQEVASTQLIKLSTRTGLIYTINNKYNPETKVGAYYWVALDFRTGEVVWEKLAGTGDKFDNWWAPIGVGPNGALYASVYGGIISMRDAP